jgi:hypothetical protein
VQRVAHHLVGVLCTRQKTRLLMHFTKNTAPNALYSKPHHTSDFGRHVTRRPQHATVQCRGTGSALCHAVFGHIIRSAVIGLPYAFLAASWCFATFVWQWSHLAKRGRAWHLQWESSPRRVATDHGAHAASSASSGVRWRPTTAFLRSRSPWIWLATSTDAWHGTGAGHGTASAAHRQSARHVPCNHWHGPGVGNGPAVAGVGRVPDHPGR